MKKLSILLILAISTLSCHKPAGLGGRSTQNFGNGWQFTKDSTAAAWQSISLPHTAQVEPLVVNNQWQGDCYYKKDFEVTGSKDEKTFLYFEGVMHDTEVWVNNTSVFRHRGGYTPFTVDVSNWVTFGSNTVALKVNNQDNPLIPPGKPLKELDFNYYGGVYRNVYLVTTGKLYITNAVAAQKPAGGGVYLHFDNVTATNATGTLKTHVKNEYPDARTLTVKAVLTDRQGTKHEFTSAPATVAAGADVSVTQNISVNNPRLWDVTNPELYTLTVTVLVDGKTVDVYETKTGIRKIEINADGFYLNDKKIFVNGTNRHQEYPYLGYAISDAAQYRDAVKIKNAGFDFVRLSHYPQSEAFLNACDELGLLVMDCISGWQFIGNEEFKENSYQEIRDLARRDRNHPSVIIWEVSLNESNMDEGYMKKANDILRAEVPYKDTYTAGWMDNANYDLFIPARQHGKAPEYWNNYSEGNRKILIAEYGDWEYYAQNAGFNQTEFGNLKEEERTSRQLRGSGEKRLLQQAFNFREAYNSNLKGNNTIGHANWLMFDYNRGYSPDLESSGISDIFRLPKFAYYFYQSQRSPSQKLSKGLSSGPMAHIASYWDESSSPDVTVFSNCDEVALYLNNVLVARQKPVNDAFSDALQYPPFAFNLKEFKKGTLRAEGYINGTKVTEHAVTTPGKAAKIELSVDTSGRDINRDTPDTVFIYAKITDENGTVLNAAELPVTFKLNGENAALVGQNPLPTEAGIATIVLRTEQLTQPIKITATAAGLPTATLDIK